MKWRLISLMFEKALFLGACRALIPRWRGCRGWIIICCIPVMTYSQTPDSVPVLNTLRYFDLGFGIGLPDGNNGLNAGLILDIDDIFALFTEYNLFFDEGDISYHETNIKAGPYVRFSKLSYIALSGGFSFMFSTDRGMAQIYSMPIQLRVNMGVTERLALGVKGTYNVVFTNRYTDRGSVFVYAAYKFRDW